MSAKLRDTWTSVQRAETLLYQAAATRDLPRYRSMLEGMNMEWNSLNLFLRLINGFNPDYLTPQDYLTRYPFSSLEAIRAGMTRLVASGHLVESRPDNFAATEQARQLICQWQQNVSQFMQSVDLGNFPSEDVQKLLDYDLRILESLTVAARPHGNPILGHRLRGLHPTYNPPRLWHHWMHVWTMLAASEDEEEYMRQRRGIAPLVWFVRRQIWFAHRRPWRARALTLETLIKRATGYSPIENAPRALAASVQILETQGWLAEESNGEFRLTDQGLAACDADEQQIDVNFTACWPKFNAVEIEELLDITTRLNARFLEVIHSYSLINQPQVSTGGKLT